MKSKKNQNSEEFPKEKYNILNRSITLTDSEQESLRQDMKKKSDWLKIQFNIKN